MSYTNFPSDQTNHEPDVDTRCPGAGCDCPDCKAQRASHVLSGPDGYSESDEAA